MSKFFIKLAQDVRKDRGVGQPVAHPAVAPGVGVAVRQTLTRRGLMASHGTEMYLLFHALVDRCILRHHPHCHVFSWFIL